VVGGLVQFKRLEKAQFRSRLVWWSVVLFNLEDWVKRSCEVDWSGGRWSCLIKKTEKRAVTKYHDGLVVLGLQNLRGPELVFSGLIFVMQSWYCSLFIRIIHIFS
jgi:hypothetical protein